MTRPVHFWWMYGMYGPVTDPGSRRFDARVKQTFPLIDMHLSPYRDYQLNQIVSEIMRVPLAVRPIILVGGTSLGSNNTPIVARYLQLSGYTGLVHGELGFQASMWGEKAGMQNYFGIPANVLYAHLITSDTVIPFPGIGAYQWVKAPGNNRTELEITPTHHIHPGDGDEASQDVFLGDIQRIITNPGDGL